MAEATYPAGGSEAAPVNPYNLLEAVNRASAETRIGWLVGLAVLTLAALPLAAITHRDLLLDTVVMLPLVALKVPLPVYLAGLSGVVLALHVAMLAGHAVLAGKVHAFDAAIRTLEIDERRSHPLRLEMHPFFLTEAIAGPRTGLALRGALRLMGWTSVVFAPLAVLLAAAAVSLPYHAPWLTLWQRGVVLADIAAIAALLPHLAAPGGGWWSALGRAIAVKPFASFAALVLLAAVAAFATVAVSLPGEALDRAVTAVIGPRGGLLSLIERVVPRNLALRHGAMREGEANAAGLDLSGRDLRGANLDGQKLANADLTGADLRGARLVGADLGAARLTGANLESAVLDRAWLAGADLARARLVAASLKDVELEGASLAGAAAAGASFAKASLSGADLSGASLLGTDLMDAVLPGADLTDARLDAALLKNADLEGAVLKGASLYGADLSNARIGVADLRGARVWQTVPPGSDPSGLADFSEVKLGAPDEAAITELRQQIAGVGMVEGTRVLEEALKGVLDPAGRGAWAGSGALQRWQGLVSAGTQTAAGGYASRLTDVLARLMCRPRAAVPGVAIGVVRRAGARDFRGDPVTLVERMRNDDCAQVRNLPARLLQDMAVAAERARGEGGSVTSGEGR